MKTKTVIRGWSRLARLWRHLYRRESAAWGMICRQSTEAAQRPWRRRYERYCSLRARVEEERCGVVPD